MDENIIKKIESLAKTKFRGSFHLNKKKSPKYLELSEKVPIFAAEILI